MPLPLDLQDVVAEVISQVPRLLTLQDRDPDSPMRGCMHPAYWRDKSSDVADMRRQEAALAFAWLWRHELPGNRWQGDRKLLHASLRALGFWHREQHADGTFDEWYKNEHGYATTAFSSYAVALTVEALEDELRDPLRGAVLAALRRCGQWLATHDDWFKTNHEAVGVAALGAVGRVLEEPAFLEAARRNARLIVERMHPEGWSQEISGLDLGYTFLLAEYLGMHAVLTGETEFLPDIVRAYDFAADFLHPDLTTGAEYGICGNPYFSRVGTVALAPHGASAAAALRWMERPVDGPRDTASTLKDDLRLARYAYQPLLAALLHQGSLTRKEATPEGGAGDFTLLFEPGEALARWRPEAGLLAIRRHGYAAWAAPAHGGLVRAAFRDGEDFLAPVVDRGFAIDAGEGRARTYRNARYGREEARSFDADTGVLECDAALARCAFVMPPYLARVGLRIATSLPKGHRWTRWAIDQWRRRKGTALNQSAAGVSGGKSPFHLHRTVRFDEAVIEISDHLEAREGHIDPRRTWLILDGPVRTADGQRPDQDRRLPLSGVMDQPASHLRLRRRLSREGDDVVLELSRED